MRSSGEPLNPTLYSLLERYYGSGEVAIVSPGVEIAWELVYNRSADDGEHRAVRKVWGSGEEYRVRCRACRDYRPRLYFNHRWGVYDEGTGTHNLWLANCFNQNCYAEYLRQVELFKRIYRTTNTRAVKLRSGRAQEAPGEILPVKPPGVLYRLDEVRKQDPDHPSVVYLESRGFDADWLARRYGVSYCASSRYSLACNRIIIPIFHEKKMVGWQARYIGDDVDGKSLKQAGVLKYWTSPGFRRRRVAYNYETAIRHQTILISEGPMDVWNAGPMTLGLLGKTMSPELIQQLCHDLRDRADAVVVIALDPEWDESDLKRGRPHHIERLYRELYQPLGGRVVRAWLPLGTDCGSLDRDVQRALYRKAAKKEGVTIPLTFTRPSRAV